MTRILGTGRNPDLLADVKKIAPDRIDVRPAGTAELPDWVRERTGGEGVDIVIDALGPGAPAAACSGPSTRSNTTPSRSRR